MSPERRGRPTKNIKSMVQKYRKRPALWLEDTFGTKLWEMQEKILESTFNNRYTAVKSAFGTGKSYGAGAIALAFLGLTPDSIVITTAPSYRQLKNIWAPIHGMLENSKAPLGAKILQEEIRFAPQHYAIGFTTNMPERLQGIHAKHILIVEDESAGIDGEIHKRLKDGLMVPEDSHMLSIGNPLSPEGHFYEMFNNPNYETFTISAFDTPNLVADKEVIPGLVTKTWVEEKRREVGVDSPIWKSQVLGQFPDTTEDTLLPLSWVRAAQDRWYDMEKGTGETVYGIDPSGGGADEAVLCPRTGMFVHQMKAWQGLDSPEFLGNIFNHTLPHSRAFVDEIGVGYGIIGALRESDSIYAKGINVKNKSSKPNRFKNLRAELFWTLRDLLNPEKDDKLGLPPDETLASQLTSIKYKFDSKGRIQIESKKDMRKRGISSPDRADALVLSLSSYQTYGASPISVGVRESMQDVNDMLIDTSEFGYFKETEHL